MMAIGRTIRGTAAAVAMAGVIAGWAAGAMAEDFEVAGVTVSRNEDLRGMLPADVIEKGSLTFTTDAAGPPRTFVDENGNIAGVIPDLLGAVGAALGVEIIIEKNSFDAEVPGVQSGRFDATTGTGDFPHRRDKLDMVDYYKAGYLYLVQGGNPKGVDNDPMTQCGMRVGVIKGTTQETMVTELSEKCIAEGKDPIDLQSFNNVLLPVPLAADRIDVAWENTSTGFMVSEETPDKFAVAGEPKFPAYLGFGVAKDRPELRDTLQATLQHFMDDGTYAAIFKKWNQSGLMMDYISINSDPRN